MRYSTTALETLSWASLCLHSTSFATRFLASFRDATSCDWTIVAAAENFQKTRDDVALAAPLVPVTRLPRMSERTALPTCLSIVIFSYAIIVSLEQFSLRSWSLREIRSQQQQYGDLPGELRHWQSLTTSKAERTTIARDIDGIR
ncbi:hypothetical protein HBI42_132520 [Parastagonospora nodorum]|nr:hypothetical protein HBI71_179540 [Parastagonospora nodorum]KAH5407088.1 hypothetical protein HBI47_172990 [Parastagonospora nodorum]KAH6215449.1 hypothetical protein HBI43_131910 [Parastagonospora nodorum]KAH6254161.1 hypothetical protein HBI42_132520 [Parastagonospora nodorum]